MPLWVRAGHSSTPSTASLTSLFILHVSGPHRPPSAPIQPLQAQASGEELLPAMVRLSRKPRREGEVVGSTTALLQHWPWVALLGCCSLPGGSCVHTEDAWWDSQTSWLLFLPTVSRKQFGTTSLSNSCFPLQAHGQNKLTFLSQRGKYSQIGWSLKCCFLSSFFFFFLSLCMHLAVSTAMTKYWPAIFTKQEKQVYK